MFPAVGAGAEVICPILAVQDAFLDAIERVLGAPAGCLPRSNPPKVEAWLTGDPSVVDDQLGAMKRDHPRLYDRMLVERNQAWVPRIEAMLAEPGTSFVLVGGAHLGGDDSLLRFLTEAGLPPKRVA